MGALELGLLCSPFNFYVPRNKVAWRNDAGGFAMASPDWTMSGPVTLSLSRDAETTPVR